LSHDLILTDDNIKIPLYIRYPGCRPTTIASTVSSLDITPTLLDLAGIDPPADASRDWQGRSLRPLLDGRAMASSQRRFVRSDARLLFQSGRISALRTDDYKYMRHHDRANGRNEELYDLHQDPWEGSDLAGSPAHQAVLAEFRNEFAQQEEAAIAFHLRYGLTRGFSRLKNRADHSPRGTSRLLMAFLPESSGYYELASRMIREVFPAGTRVDVVVPEAYPRHDSSNREYLYRVEPDGRLRFTGDGPHGPYDLRVVFTVDPQNEASTALQELLRGSRARESFVLDCNLNTFDRPRFWQHRMQALQKRLPILRHEPLAALGLISRAGRVLRARFFPRKRQQA
jgi:hypothetical protein